TDNTVEQGGSSARCVNSTPVYQLWWEMFPTNSIQPVLTISAGDDVGADVRYDPTSGNYTITVDDSTAGTSFTTTQKCAAGLTCNRSTAEWIAEAPGRSSGGFFPLANYGHMQMDFCVGSDSLGNAGSITEASPTWQRNWIQEQDATTTYAT